MVKNRRGVCKGFAYVDFTDKVTTSTLSEHPSQRISTTSDLSRYPTNQASLAQGLRLNGYTLLGRELKVLKSAPLADAKARQPGGGTGAADR